MQKTAIAMMMALACAVAMAEENRWENAIQAFERTDAENPPPKGEIVFVGSSSIRFWNTEESFPDLTIINRGFGGSQTADSLEFADRIVIPYEPRVVVLYAGDNDIAAGKTPDQVVADTKAFFAKIHDALPETRIVYVPIKPSIARWHLIEPMRESNAKVRKLTEADPRIFYIDIDTPMLGGDGKPREELFISDGLHLSKEGYALWNKIIRPYLNEEPPGDE